MTPSRSMELRRMRARRLRATPLFERGVYDAEIARQLKVSRQCVSRWRIRWEKEEKHGAIPIRGGGPEPKIRKIAEELVAKIRGANARRGIKYDLWTVKEFVKLLRDYRPVKFSQAYIRRLMPKIGFEKYERNEWKI